MGRNHSEWPWLPTMISSTFRFISYFCKFINLSILQFLIYIASQRKADQAVIGWEEKQKERTKKRKMKTRGFNNAESKATGDTEFMRASCSNQLHTCAYVYACTKDSYQLPEQSTASTAK